MAKDEEVEWRRIRRLNGEGSTTGNTGWIFIILGKSSLHEEPFFSTTLNRPSISLSSFLHGRSVYRFFKDSQTLSPI